MEEVVLMLCFGRDFFFPGSDGAGEKSDGGGNVGLGIELSACAKIADSG